MIFLQLLGGADGIDGRSTAIYYAEARRLSAATMLPTTTRPPSAASAIEPMDKPTKRIPDVRLEHFQPNFEGSETDTNLLIEAFNVLLRTSADAALEAEPNIYSFQEKCLYFALIHDDALNTPGEDIGRELSIDWRDETTPAERFSGRQQQGFNQFGTTAQTSVLDWRARAMCSSSGEAPRDPFGYYEDDAALDITAHEDTMMTDIYEYEQPLPASRLIKTFVGIIYFLPHYPLEVSLGLALLPAHCNRGIGPRAVLQALEMAFDQFAFHRVIAAIVDGPSREHAVRMFVALGFGHEGTRRRAIMSAGPGHDENTWRDVHVLGLLDTDWAMNGGAQAVLKYFDTDINIDTADNNDGLGKGKAKAKRTRWDEMFARHQREREDVVGFDERAKVLRRTLSTETLRPGTSAADSSNEAFSASEAESDVESVSARDRLRAVSPVSSIATNHFASERGFTARMQPGMESVHSQVPSGSASVLEDRETMVSAWRTSSQGFDIYGDNDRESDSEVQALIPSARRYSRRTPPRCSSLVDPVSFDIEAMQPMNFASPPPPPSDTESVCTYASESEVERYASCEEEDDDDDNDTDIDGEGIYVNEAQNNNSSSTVLSRLPSGLSIVISELEAPDPLVSLFYSHRDAKRRRVNDDGIVLANASADDGSRAPTPEAQPEPESVPVAGPSGHSFLQDPPTPTFFAPSLVPSLSYRFSERDIHGTNATGTTTNDAELDWDVLSSASESESSETSSSSLSLQSASDSE